MAGYGDQPHFRIGDQLWLWDGEPWEWDHNTYASESQEHS